MNPRFPASARLVRLLALIPHVAGRGFVPLDEIAQRFEYPRKQLLADLGGVLPYVGVPPYSPDTLIEVTFDEDRVRIDYADWFAKPMRLSPSEAVALLAAGTLLLQAGDDEYASGPLLRGVAKLAGALGAGGEGAVDVQLGAASEETLALLRAAVAQRRCVELDYYSYGRDARHVRVVEPHRFFVDDGNWYVAAHCRRAQGDRLFRVDRIRHAELLDETFEPPTPSHTAGTATAGGGEASSFEPSPEDPRVVLELAPGARWVLEQYPNDGVEDLPGGRARVVLPVTARAWLERLLLRLGPDATVVDAPAPLGGDLRAQAARRILDRYPDSGTEG